MRGPRLDRELLAGTAADCTSLAQLQDRLGLPADPVSRANLLRRLARYGISTARFTDVRAYGQDLIGREVLTAAVSASTSVAGVLRALGIAGNTSGRRRVRRSLAAYGLDTSHFTGQRHFLGTVSPARKPAERILVRREAGAGRTRTGLLRRALDEIGVPRVCAACGTGEAWQGRRLVLEIDHISGDRSDDRRENLRYLCPSCHSQTAGFGGRSGRARAARDEVR
ncbi:HNH endonuclease signature motif containing protein [Streptomyces sp. CA2R106]|uniref:HNH endonuclease signature motif containing protein n=1 Tax=Streptomyces sp. CA2R106 TaxID=3120153 RepID=UPI00300B8D1D